MKWVERFSKRASEGVLFGYTFGFVAIGVLCVICANTPVVSTSFAVLLFGLVLGWTLGMLLSPVSGKEERTFSVWTKGIITFVSGYGVAHLRTIWNLCFKDAAPNEANFRQFIVFGTATLLGILFTFVARSYVGELSSGGSPPPNLVIKIPPSTIESDRCGLVTITGVSGPL